MSFARTIYDRDLQAATLAEMLAHLTTTRGFRLKPEDLTGIEDIYDIRHFGPSITYSSVAEAADPEWAGDPAAGPAIFRRTRI